MGYTVVHRPKNIVKKERHKCLSPEPIRYYATAAAVPGTIIQCDECHKYSKAYQSQNYIYWEKISNRRARRILNGQEQDGKL